MLFVVSAQAAIVRAAPLDGGVEDCGHFWGLDKDLAAAAVIFDIVGQQDLFTAMLGAPLQHENLAVLKDDFSFHLRQTARADRDCNVIEEIRTNAFCQ